MKKTQKMEESDWIGKPIRKKTYSEDDFERMRHELEYGVRADVYREILFKLLKIEDKPIKLPHII